MKLTISSPKRTAIFLFLISVAVRLIILISYDGNRVAPDSVGYHRIAVNIVRGNGFSNQEGLPFEKSYFREIGYPYFLSGIYSIVNIFHPVQYIGNYNNNTYTLDKTYPEIIAAKGIQIILDSFSVVLLFFIFIEVASIELAFLTALITAVFFNLAVHSLYILRETLVMFLLLVLNLTYIKFISNSSKYRWLILMGIIMGLLILIFQVNLILLPVMFVLFIIKFKKFRKAFKDTVIVSLIVLSFILPNCIKTYNFCPDVRILKTLGTSLTYELIKYNKTLAFLKDINLLTEEDVNNMSDWEISSRTQFERSFNGYYAQKSDSLIRSVPSKFTKHSYILKRSLSVYISNFKKSFFLTKLGYESGQNLYAMYGMLILIPLVLIPSIVGFLGLAGLFFFRKKYLIYFLPFISYSILFWLLGTEYRRMIVVQPYLIFFSILLFQQIFLLIKDGSKNEKLIFKT